MALLDDMTHTLYHLADVVTEFQASYEALDGLHLLSSAAMQDPALWQALTWDHLWHDVRQGAAALPATERKLDAHHSSNQPSLRCRRLPTPSYTA